MNDDVCALNCQPVNCICPVLYYQCPSGGCIPWSFVCNGYNDCKFDEDEKNLCVDNNHLTKVTLKDKNVSSSICDGFQCSTGKCIPLEKVNDFRPDCEEADDEELYKSLLNQEQEMNADSCKTCYTIMYCCYVN